MLVRSFEELQQLGVGWCDYIDASVSWVDDADWPAEWRCPECGGTDFDGVHADYQQSGLKGASFAVSAVDEQDREEGEDD